jgi:hypothetical protein
MRHTRVILAILALPLVILACGGGDDAAPAAPRPAPMCYAVDPAEAAVITGTVRFEGTRRRPSRST